MNEILVFHVNQSSCEDYFTFTSRVSLKGICIGWKNMVNTMSVEIKSKTYVKNVVISNDAHDHVLFVVELGDLVELSFIDDEVLEYIGTNGTFRVDLKRKSLKKLFANPNTKTLAPNVRA
jgi:hypothetical protein